jgi:hypothetical protein
MIYIVIEMNDAQQTNHSSVLLTVRTGIAGEVMKALEPTARHERRASLSIMVAA